MYFAKNLFWGSSIIQLNFSPGKSGSRHVFNISGQSLPSKQNTGFLIFKSLANAENQYRPK